MDYYPLMMEPSYRSGRETPWGGHTLREKFHKKIPDETTGESLEISALPGCESRVANGGCKGETLQEVFRLWGDRMTGKKAGRFPLLLKLLDAQQPLSVQVHPGDEYARAHEGKQGKSEAWYILDAVPGAKLVYGVDTRGESLDAIVAGGRLESCLRWVPARPGDVFYIPSGTIHALGPGIQCYEIQQSSDVTYRFWDWGRLGKDGRPRELHTAQALAVSDPEGPPAREEPERQPLEGGTKTLLVDDPHFQLYAVDLDGSVPLEEGKMQFLTPTAACIVRWDGGVLPVEAYRTVLVPACMRSVAVSGRGRILVSCA